MKSLFPKPPKHFVKIVKIECKLSLLRYVKIECYYVIRFVLYNCIYYSVCIYKTIL